MLRPLASRPLVALAVRVRVEQLLERDVFGDDIADSRHLGDVSDDIDLDRGIGAGRRDRGVLDGDRADAREFVEGEGLGTVATSSVIGAPRSSSPCRSSRVPVATSRPSFMMPMRSQTAASTSPRMWLEKRRWCRDPPRC